MLGYIYDLRWHPGKTLIAHGVKCTLNNDGTSYWGKTDLSLEFLYAYAAWDLDLSDLKQLAINSIEYSSLDRQTKDQHLGMFYRDWATFIENTISNHNLIKF